MGQSKERYMEEQELRGEDSYSTRTLQLTPEFNLSLSKTGAAEFHKRTAAKIANGQATATEYVEVIKFFAKLNEEIFGTQSKEGDAAFRAIIMDEIRQYGKEHTTARGAKFELAEVSSKYDYSLNPEWVAMDEQIKALSERKKELEDRLKRIEPGKMLIDEETGETLIGPAKSSKSSFKVTLPK